MPAPLLTGDEPLHITSDPSTARNDAPRILDFWRWAFSNLQDNTVRGVFAEWLVARILNIPLTTPRNAWAACDLVTAEGIRIEVKCGAYRQSWHTAAHDAERLSKPVWTNLESRTWDAGTRQYAKDRTCNADLYVFCIHTTRSFDGWNALYLDQWQFYVVSRIQLKDRTSRQLSEARLRDLTNAVSAAHLASAARAAATNLSPPPDLP